MARKVFASRDDRVALSAAAAAAAEAMVLAPEQAETHIAAGHVALHQGDAVSAAQHLRRAISVAPQAAEAHEWLGRLLLEAGYLDDGIAWAHLDIAGVAWSDKAKPTYDKGATG